MEAKTGKILCSTVDPRKANALGPVTVANGVVFAGSTHPKGPIYAINARSGKVMSYETGATVYGGISVSNGCIYVGHGHSLGLGSFFSYTSETSLFAFSIS
ncbi:LOW QUALITY PROTEIN: Quinoprotein alcohol dehydrogenase-like domain containing protein [Trema orientale]|uniref:Quinoprotein alcohol dehydrogenase-like domain containing protein n=1 Tax=Trema orientale TaxID=63057 RepID=A0A2P5AV35_TREOI|nr:LOW QUALITY PROTEIN: Quinoprotein alcohol dehydrogenase-like domain containing protein [Trema orientale]